MTAQTDRLRAQARRLTTPMPGAPELQVTWHVWGPAERDGTRPPVILLHGGSGSWTHWVRNIEPLLAAGHTVAAPDIPGFGDSDLPPGGHDVDAVVEPLAQGARQLLADPAVLGAPATAGEGRAAWVGFSFGGMTAGLVAAQSPDLCERVVVVGAPAMGILSDRQFTLKGWRHLQSEAAQMAVHRHNLEVLMFSDPALIDDEVLQMHVENVHRDRMPRRRLAATDILAQALRRTPCPVHAIYGASDVLYGPYLPRLEAAFADAAPDFRGLTFIDGAGHWVQYERAAAFDAELARVLA